MEAKVPITFNKQNEGSQMGSNKKKYCNWFKVKVTSAVTIMTNEYEMESAKTTSLASPSWFKNVSSRLSPSMLSFVDKSRKSPILDWTPKIIIIIITQMLKKGFCTHWTTNLKWNTTHKYIYYSYFYSWQLLGRKSSIEFALLTHYLIILSATIILHYKLQTIMIFYDVRKCLNHSWNLRLKKRKTKNEI